MTYFETLMQQIAMLCLTTSINGVGKFVNHVVQEKLTKTEYVHILTEIAMRTAGCADFDSTDSRASASKITTQLLQNYDSKNADQTIDIMKLITIYMKIKPNNYPVGMEEKKFNQN